MSGPGHARFVGSLLPEAFYRACRLLMWLGIAVYFRRVTVVGRNRVPRRGAALLVANHPSTWSDVLLLYGTLGRRFHFLAEPGQFHPWPRAMLIRSFGTLPVYLSESTRDAAERNEATFRRCREHFDRGEAVALFPEGVSWLDRSLIPLKRGAARLALSYACRRGGDASFALVPVALHYSDRTAFRGDVTLRVGAAIGRAELAGEYGNAEERQVERLTERLAETLRRLGPLADDARDGRLLDVLEGVAAARRGARDGTPSDLLPRAIATSRRDHPEEHERIERLARDHARALRALRVSDAALSAPAHASGSRAAREAAFLALAAPAALAGAAIHAAPVLATRIALRAIAYGPSQIAFARITSGFFFITLSYAATATALSVLLAAPAMVALASLVLCAALGAVALAYWDRLHPILERRRLAACERRHPRLVARAKRSHDRLGEWIASIGGGSDRMP